MPSVSGRRAQLLGPGIAALIDVVLIKHCRMLSWLGCKILPCICNDVGQHERYRRTLLSLQLEGLREKADENRNQGE